MATSESNADPVPSEPVGGPLGREDDYESRIAVACLISVVWAIKLVSESRTMAEGMLIWLAFAVVCGLILITDENERGLARFTHPVIAPAVVLTGLLLLLFFVPLLLNIPGFLAAVPSYGPLEQVETQEMFWMPTIAPDPPPEGVLAFGQRPSAFRFLTLILLTGIGSVPAMAVVLGCRGLLLDAVRRFMTSTVEEFVVFDRKLKLVLSILGTVSAIAALALL